MNGGLIIPNKDTARALNDLARHTAIVRILNDIRMNMEICEIEGWDKNEYLNQIRQLLNSIGGSKIMSDLISRQAAIDALAKQMPQSFTPDGSHPADEEIFKAQEIYADCIKTIEILPSAGGDA